MAAHEHPSKCPACESTNIITDGPTPVPVCSSCGAVLDEDIDIQLPETAEEESSDQKTWAEYHSISNSTEKQVAEAIDLVESIGTSLDIESDTRKLAVNIYAEAAIKNLTDGRPTAVTVCASLILATREIGTSLPSSRLATVASVSERQISIAIRTIQQELDRQFAIPRPNDYIPHLCEAIDEPRETQATAQESLAVIQSDLNLGGKNPIALAAAILYEIDSTSVTQRELADAAGVTTETIRVRLNEIREVTGYE